MKANNFKQRLLNGEKLIGGWLMSGSPVIAELIGSIGFDFVVVDCEHSPIGADNLLMQLIALKGSGCDIVVRLADQSMMSVRKALDFGAETLVIPFVQNAEEMRAVARHAFYPPMGQRGFAGTIRAANYGRDKDYFQRTNHEIMLIPQIETPTAVANLDAIATTDGVGGIFFGPGDYSASTGNLGNAFNDDTKRVMLECAQYAKSKGLPIGTVASNPEIAHWELTNGLSFTGMKNDLAMLSTEALNIINGYNKLSGRAQIVDKKTDY